MSARTKARRRALDVLFEADQKGVGAQPDALRALAAERTTRMVAQVTLPEYAARVVEGVATHLPAIDAEIAAVARGWSLERMPAVDRAALRIGVWEIRHNDELDAAVTISEMVSIVGELSTDRSPGFVNGVLDAVARGGAPVGPPPPAEAPPSDAELVEVPSEGTSDANPGDTPGDAGADTPDDLGDTTADDPR